ncbi:MAG: CoA pyrophosphatase [Planctomycetota bacterium]
MNLNEATADQIENLLLQQKIKPIRFWLWWKKHRKAVVALCLRFHQNQLEVLMIQRSQKTGDPWSGHMAFPGGHQDQEDISEIHTAIRETQEEVGLNLEFYGRYLGPLHPVRAMVRGLPIRLVIQPVVFFLQDLSFALNPNQDEVDQVVWIPLELLNSGTCNATHSFTRGKITLDLPCWRYQNYTIWGLSYRMLASFLALLKQNRI